MALALPRDGTKGLIGGLLGTIAMTMMMYFLAPMMLGTPMDLAGELARILHVPWSMGMVVHFVLGVVIFPLIYLMFLRDRFPGPSPVRGLIWGLVLWMVAMLMMSPVMGKGLFMGGAKPALVSMMAHAVYGLLLGVVVRPIRTDGGDHS